MQVYSVVVSDHSLAYHQISESIWIQANTPNLNKKVSDKPGTVQFVSAL